MSWEGSWTKGANLQGRTWDSAKGNPVDDITALAERLRQEGGLPRPPNFYAHQSMHCWLKMQSLNPAERPLDFEAWQDPKFVKRPLKCVQCGVRLARNSPRRFGNPYCGPHWRDPG